MSTTIFTLAGMHRSGTSVIAHWLFQSGFAMGTDLLEAASSNPKGHFEDKEFLELHRQDLLAKGLHDSGLYGVEGPLRLSVSSKERASQMLEKRRSLECWGWKEPRTVLYLDHWKQILPQLKVVGVFREPEYVAQSLYRRLQKNKWYYTRNPLKRLAWYLDIDLQPGKWEKVFLDTGSLYNQQLISFADRFPGDTLLLELGDILESPDRAGKVVASFLGSQKALVPFQEVFEPSLMTATAKVMQGIPDPVYQQLIRYKYPLNKT